MGASQSTQSSGASSSSSSSSSSCDVELFLIGKTGNGKSSTGNTILGYDDHHPYFPTSDMGDSATLDTGAGWTNRNNMKIKVVDGPGLLDTRLAGMKQLEQLEENVSKGFVHCPNGFHALLLVMRYGIRFTEDERKTVHVLKAMLGDDFTKNHCILVFTDGESFTKKNGNMSFKDWCMKQGGEIGTLISECRGRVVLFHNLTPEKASESTDQLLSLAMRVPKRYTADIFRQIASERAKFIATQGAIELKDLIQEKINLIINCLATGKGGQELQDAVYGLSKEIAKEKDTLPVVRDVKRGIQQIRMEQYPEAFQTFKNIEYGGRTKLKIFLGIVKRIVRFCIQTFKFLFL